MNSETAPKKRRPPGRTPASGYKGVYLRPSGKYRAMVWLADGKSRSLGLHKTKEQAAAAVARHRGDEDEARRLEAKDDVYDPDEVTRRATPAEIAYARGYRPGSNDRAIV